MVKSLHESIRKTLSSSKEEGAKKQISLIIDERMLQMTDVIVEQFKNLTGGRIASSRNQLIEMAIEEYVQAAADVLLQDHFINIDELVKYKDEVAEVIEESASDDKNLVIFAARNDGFEEVFLNKNQWYSVSIAAKNIPKIRYVACYRGAPYSGITHYAEIDKIEPFEGTKRYIIHFKGQPIPLRNTVRLGNGKVTDVRGKTRYTSLDRLLNSLEISELWT
ncbi:hypothetical protein P4H66_17815 [Paenibacillus dokdonensis]|uniref:Uncharacterized protein n=1 Tax=Paenibacillus dokdonensis TaxID=2567944 RepID=A0ABU6GRG8_9BACL|nr:hypothetical protein [Paenibacillus dokdonensis]MEC0241677.1 hypothetical protein [Paenibacillus dokdonensis]